MGGTSSKERPKSRICRSEGGSLDIKMFASRRKVPTAHIQKSFYGLAHIPDERQRKQHLDEWAGFFATSSSLAVSLYVPRHIEAFRLPESLRSKARAVAKQYKDITWDAFNTKMVRETWLNLVDIAVAFNLAPTHFSGTWTFTLVKPF